MSKSKIKSLNLSGKNITGILDLSDYSNLEYLDCSHNQITEIINISHLIKYIDCSYNLIKSLGYEYTNHQYLDFLNCSHNPITSIFYPFNIKPKKYPSTLKYIEYAVNFNQPIDNLPEGLETINFFAVNIQIVLLINQLIIYLTN